MQIQYNGTASVLFVEPVFKSPCGVTAHSLHGNGFQFSISAGFITVFQIPVFIKGTDHLTNHNLYVVPLLGIQKLLCLLLRQTYRFLHEHIDPSVHGCHRMFCVEITGKADMHAVQRLRFQKFHTCLVQSGIRPLLCCLFQKFRSAVRQSCYLNIHLG